MVKGIDSFREWFRGYEKQYVLIGGTACDLLMSNEGLDFRATKDIDLVLIIESVDAAFGKRFWKYVVAAGYEHRNRSTSKPQFYRFVKPKSEEYPTMIELFTRKPDVITLPEDAILTPIPMDEEVSSLSAILLDDNYYKFLRQGRIRLTELLNPEMEQLQCLPDAINADMREFIERMMLEDTDLKQLGIQSKNKEEILDELRSIYL